jgi:hypothetical protein
MPFVPLIAAAISFLSELIPQIAKWRAAALQNAELTPEQDAAFDAKLKALFDQAHWKIEP